MPYNFVADTQRNFVADFLTEYGNFACLSPLLGSLQSTYAVRLIGSLESA